jgi:hypothetical protein
MLSTRKINDCAKVVAPELAKNAVNGLPFLFNRTKGLVFAIGNDGFAPRNGRSQPVGQQFALAHSCRSLIKHTTSHTQLLDPHDPQEWRLFFELGLELAPVHEPDP